MQIFRAESLHEPNLFLYYANTCAPFYSEWTGSENVCFFIRINLSFP